MTKLSRFALIALATIVFSAFTARPASAAWAFCVRLDAASGFAEYFMNFVVQGNGILVTGSKGRAPVDNHGPLFGSLSQAPTTGTPTWELGFTVTMENMGDFSGPNTENVVFQFVGSSINYKRWLRSSDNFVQGTATVIACPAH